jgi:hypothetical protein
MASLSLAPRIAAPTPWPNETTIDMSRTSLEDLRRILAPVIASEDGSITINGVKISCYVDNGSGKLHVCYAPLGSSKPIYIPHGQIPSQVIYYYLRSLVTPTDNTPADGHLSFTYNGVDVYLTIKEGPAAAPFTAHAVLKSTNREVRVTLAQNKNPYQDAYVRKRIRAMIDKIFPKSNSPTSPQ